MVNGGNFWVTADIHIWRANTYGTITMPLFINSKSINLFLQMWVITINTVAVLIIEHMIYGENDKNNNVALLYLCNINWHFVVDVL